MSSSLIKVGVCLCLISAVMMSGCMTEDDDYHFRQLMKPVMVVKYSEQWCEETSTTPEAVETCYASMGKVSPSKRPVWNGTIYATIFGGFVQRSAPVSIAVVETVATTIPTTEPTPKPTVTVEPSSPAHYVNPYSDGERWEGMWFRWNWFNVSGFQSAKRGIVIYNHYYFDKLTYWDDAWGTYNDIYPPKGQRILAVFVHQEDFSPDNSGLWGYQYNSSFMLQYDNKLHAPYEYTPVYRIKELEESKRDYYNIDYIKPYGLKRVYGGLSEAATGGYHVEYMWSLWSGPGNAWDGYILYLVPVTINDSDIRIVGNFAGNGVNWRFDDKTAQIKYPASRNIQETNP